MIYTINNDRTLNYSSSLIDYIKENNLYNGENLMYSNKYTNGTFTITNPTSEYKNCSLVNGYPHFQIPLDVCLNEINDFINNRSIYDNDFYIRYGDTHPHKPIPKLAQVRNLLVENSLSSLIGNNATSYYGLGDISIKSLNDFINKYNINISVDILFSKIVNNELDEETINKLLSYDKNAILKIKELIEILKLNSKAFLIESTLYSNKELYQSFKNDPKYKDELKDNGELKYYLQELMFINYLLHKKNDVLINIIGANQSEHVLKVNKILAENNYNFDSRFLTYGICRNGDERDINEWSKNFERFIYDNKISINNRLLNYDEMLRIIITVVKNDNILDFSKLNKYLKNINSFCNIISNLDNNVNNSRISKSNHLINKMALVNYNLNKAIEMGEQNNFYCYLLEVVKEYESNKEEYKEISGLYYEFINASFKKLGFNDLLIENSKIRRLNK